jgi:hypothetical protein
MRAHGFHETAQRLEVDMESWSIPGTDSMRTESRVLVLYRGEVVSEELARSVVIEGTRYSVSDDSSNSNSFVRCHGGSIVASAILDCFGPRDDSESTFEIREGEHDGRASIVLIASGETVTDSGVATGIAELHLDPSTLLPIARVELGTFDDSVDVHPLASELDYDFQWIERGSLSVDFFELDSIGYVETTLDPEEGLKALRPGSEAYWLGAVYEPGGALPTLQLISSYAGPPYDISVAYGTPDGNPILTTQQFSSDELELGDVPARIASLGKCWKTVPLKYSTAGKA